MTPHEQRMYEIGVAAVDEDRVKRKIAAWFETPIMSRNRNDRCELSQLRRNRDAAQVHLEWALDRAIAAEEVTG